MKKSVLSWKDVKCGLNFETVLRSLSLHIHTTPAFLVLGFRPTPKCPLCENFHSLLCPFKPHRWHLCWTTSFRGRPFRNTRATRWCFTGSLSLPSQVEGDITPLSSLASPVCWPGGTFGQTLEGQLLLQEGVSVSSEALRLDRGFPPAYMCVRASRRLPFCVYMCVCVCVSSFLSMCVHVYECMYVRACVCRLLPLSVCVQTYECIHVCSYV